MVPLNCTIQHLHEQTMFVDVSTETSPEASVVLQNDILKEGMDNLFCGWPMT